MRSTPTALSLAIVIGIAMFLTGASSSPAPVASAGPDRTAFVNETLSLDGTGASGWYDGLQSDGRYSSRWDFGYGGWTYEGGDRAPVAYPKAGTYTVTRTVCDQNGSCASDTAIVTVTEITCATQTSLGDTLNPTQNMAALQAEVDASTSTASKCINLPAGAVYRGQLVLKSRSVSSYLTIRTAAFGSLPDGTTRVTPANAASMAILETASNASIVVTPATSSNPARYYNFLGIQFRKSDPALAYDNASFVWLGQGDETSLAQLPNHIGFDRCFFDGGSTTSNTLRGVRFHGASDSWVANSYLYRFKGVAIETQALFIGSGERDAFLNNFASAATECFLSGGARPSNITNHVPTDIVIRRNDMEKDIGWCSFCGAYYGVDMSVKNVLELKLGLRFSIQGNRFGNHWAEDQNWAIVFTVRGENGTVPWGNITGTDFAFNKMVKVGNGMQVLGRDYLGTSGIVDHLLVRQNSWAGISYYNGFKNAFIVTDGTTATQTGGGNFIMMVRNSTDQNGDNGQGRFLMLEDSTQLRNLFGWGNISQGYITGPSGSTGVNALQAATAGSFNFKKNGFYKVTGTNPTDNTTVNLITDVKYLSLPGFDLSLLSDSPFLATGLNGDRAGVDMVTLNLLTAGTVSGIWDSTPTPTPTPTPTATPTPTPTPTPNPSPSPTPTPGPVCRPNQLISSGCTCTTKIVGPPDRRRCK